MLNRHFLLCLFAAATASAASAQQIGTTYCSSTPNSTGVAAELSAFGVPEQATGNVILLATDCPAGQVGIFFYGANQASLPFQDGTLCISAAGGGIVRINPAVTIDANGNAQHDLASSQTYPGPGGTPGQLEVNYQFWYRDPAAMGTGSNTSSAVEIEYTPCLNCS